MENNNNLTYAFKDFVLNGLGADLIRLTGLLAYCENNGINFHLCKNDVWMNVPSGEKERNWLYYFDESIPMDVNDSYRHVTEDLLKKSNTTFVPANQNISKFNYRSGLIKRIYLPKQAHIIMVKDYINQHLPFLLNQQFLLDQQYVIVHIRRGDKVAGPWKENEIIPTEKYLSTLKTYGKIIKSNENPIVAFIITDSNDVINEMAGYEKEFETYGIKLKWDKNETRRDGYCFKLFKYGFDDSNIRDEMFTFIKNMYIMQNSKEMIGARMSFLYIAAELLRGKKSISLADNTAYPVDFY